MESAIENDLKEVRTWATNLKKQLEQESADDRDKRELNEEKTNTEERIVAAREDVEKKYENQIRDMTENCEGMIETMIRRTEAMEQRDLEMQREQKELEELRLELRRKGIGEDDLKGITILPPSEKGEYGVISVKAAETSSETENKVVQKTQCC